MRVFTLCFLLFALALPASAQDVKAKDRLTQEENETWLQKYQQLDDSEEKLKMIKPKILYDAQFVGPRPGISLTGLNEAQRQALKEQESKKPRITADCKILFVLQTTQSHFLDLEKSWFLTLWTKKIAMYLSTLAMYEGGRGHPKPKFTCRASLRHLVTLKSIRNALKSCFRA